MRIVSLLFVFFLFSLVSAQEGRVANQPQEQEKIPTTLSEAHAELERILPPQELAKIDAMPSEDRMIQYHKGLGAGIRFNWGLWRDSPLAKHMQELGFTHPDEMSSVILETFWCKRHGKDFHLEERTPAYRKSMKAAQKAQEEREEQNRVKKAETAIRDMMMMGVLSGILLLGGLVCLAISKLSLRKQGACLSFGFALMSRYAGLHKVAYLLMGMGVLLMVLLLNAMRGAQAH